MDIIDNIKDYRRVPLNLQSRSRVLEQWLGKLGLDFQTIPDEHEEQLVIYGDDFRDFLLNPDSHLPRFPAALCLTDAFGGSYLENYNLGVRHVLFPGQFMANECLTLALTPHSILRELKCPENVGKRDRATGLARTIVTPGDRKSLEEELGDFLSGQDFSRETIGSVTLCLKEAVTNAIFHGYRESGTHERKYNPDSFLGLYDNDEIRVSVDLTEEWLRLSIRDNSGILGLLRVANSLDRHHSSQGLMDSRGRGLYLMHHMAQRIVILVHKRRQTCVELYFSRKAELHSGPHQLQMISV